MTMKTNDIRTNAKTVMLPASIATTALHFLQRVVVHGEEQTELFRTYQSIMHALSCCNTEQCVQCDARHRSSDAA